MHREIVARSLDRALGVNEAPRRVLDVGCGTGVLLRLLAERLTGEGQELLGIDAAAGMVEEANAQSNDPRIRVSLGTAEKLPYADGYFDVVISTTSFDHWRDQDVGIRECYRVLAPGCFLILTDVFSLFWAPSILFGRRGHARTKRRASALLNEAGFRAVTWHHLYRGIIATAIAEK